MHIHKNKVIFMIISFLLWFPHFLYVPILSPYMSAKGISYTFIGIVLGSYGIMQLLLRIPIGIGSDILNNKKMFIVLGMFASFLSCTIFIFADSGVWLLTARTLAGAGAASWVAFTIMYTGFFTPEKMTAAMGSISFIIVLAQYISMSISGMLVDMFGWEAPFYIATLCSLIGLILTGFIHEENRNETTKDEPMRFKDIPSVVKNSTLLKAALLSIFAHSIMFATIFGFMPNVAMSIGFTEGSLIYVVGAFMIPHAIGTLLIGNVIVPRLGIYLSLMLSFLVVFISLIVIPFTSSQALFLFFQAFTGFGLGVIFPVLLGLPIKNISDKKKTTAMGVYQSLYAIGIFGGPYVSGWMNNTFGLTSGYYFLAVLAVLGTSFVMYWSKKQKDTQKYLKYVQ